MTAAQGLLRNLEKPELEDFQAPPFLSIGFRPFFFGAALTAVFWVPLWIAVLEGAPFRGHLPAASLHAHEMLFGFAVAVIAGFLLTAGANWTGQRTTSGLSLAGLFLLWVLGRVALLSDDVPRWAAVMIDLSFLPAVAATLALPLFRAGSTRNFQFLGMLGLLFLANALMHAGGSAEFVSLVGLAPNAGQTLALRVITFMILVMGGRVIPMFTRNATRNERIHANPKVDRVALVAFGLAALVDGLFFESKVSGVLLGLAGALHLFRMKTWGTRSARAPLLWILHFGYVAVALSLLLEALSVWGLLPRSAALHLLTVGGIGGLCLGMMTRVSLGHSGRMLVAPRFMTLSFGLLVLATVVRVLGPVVSPELVLPSYRISGTCFALSFALLLVFGVPIWFRARVDRSPVRSL